MGALGEILVGQGVGILRALSGEFLFAFSCYSGEVTSLHSELRAMLHGVKICVQ